MEDRVLVHHGVDGQEWGKRKYQNPDGSLTPLGRIHYGVGEARDRAKIKMKEEKAKAKNEIKIAKAKAKAEAAKIKAEAKAYKIRKSAETRVERERIKADKDLEKERIKTDRELEKDKLRSEENKERMISEENQNIAKTEAKKQTEIVEATSEASKAESRSKVMKAALAAAAATGIAYLLYKAVKGGKVEGVSETVQEKASSVINTVKDEAVSKFTSSEPTVFTPRGSTNTNTSSNPAPTSNSSESSNKSVFNNLHNGGGKFTRYNKVTVNEDGSTTTKTKMIRPNIRSNFVKKHYETASAANDKVKNSKRKTKYVVNPKGEYYKVTRNADGSTTETPSKAVGATAKKAAKAFRDYYNMIYNPRKRVRHADEHEGMVLCHHGILGMHWGVRRWQYEDGTLTPEGKIHYGKKAQKALKKADKYDSKTQFGDLATIHAIKKDKGFQNFNKEFNKSEAGKKMIESYVDNTISLMKVTHELLENMHKKYGDDYPSSDEKLANEQRIECGKEFVRLTQKYTPEMLESSQNYIDSAKEYREKAKEFVKDYLGSTADELSATNRVHTEISKNEDGTINIEAKKSTIGDRAYSSMVANMNIPVNEAKTKLFMKNLNTLQDYNPDKDTWKIGNKNVKTEDLPNVYKSMSNEKRWELIDKLETVNSPNSPIKNLDKTMKEMYKIEGQKELDSYRSKDPSITVQDLGEDSLEELGRRKLFS